MKKLAKSGIDPLKIVLKTSSHYSIIGLLIEAAILAWLTYSIVF